MQRSTYIDSKYSVQKYRSTEICIEVYIYASDRIIQTYTHILLLNLLEHIQHHSFQQCFELAVMVSTFVLGLELKSEEELDLSLSIYVMFRSETSLINRFSLLEPVFFLHMYYFDKNKRQTPVNSLVASPEQNELHLVPFFIFRHRNKRFKS